MKMCMPHWEKLKAEIDKAGLTPFISSSGQEAMRKMVTSLEQANGEPTLATFDPLMFAHNAIIGNALNAAGLEVLVGDKCPICFLRADNWITFAVRDAATAYSKIVKAGAA